MSEENNLRKLGVYSLDEFLKTKFPISDSILKGLINRQELHLFTATAKTGKTMMALNLALAVAKGERFLGKFETTPGRVLIWQTEVSGSRMQERLEKMIGETE